MEGLCWYWDTVRDAVEAALPFRVRTDPARDGDWVYRGAMRWTAAVPDGTELVEGAHP
jgi:hypothetical protein